MSLGCKVLISSKCPGQYNCTPFLNKSQEIISNAIILQRRKGSALTAGAEGFQYMYIYFYKPTCPHHLVDVENHVYHLFYNLKAVYFTGMSYLFHFQNN
jgi:hypothetical protein